MAGQYQWLSLTTAISQLGQRLNITPSSTSTWTTPELVIYLQQSLRVYNVLTYKWRQDYTYSDPSDIWNSLGQLAGSPRLRTITDVYCYTELEYMLFEPPSGGSWTGTNQFSIDSISQALQTRRDEMLQVSNANQSLLSGIALTPGTTRTQLPDTIIDVERVRYLPTGGTPNTLSRDDMVAQEFYQAPLYQLAPGTPQTFGLSSEPPLTWDVDIAPNQVGTYEAVVLQSGPALNPPAATILGIPNDFAWVLEWGALADLLGHESEATDRERADYAMKRYRDGLQLLLKTPWIELGKVNGEAVTIDSIVSMDRYSPEWDSNPAGFGPVIVSGGVDFIAAPVGSGVGVTVLANAPYLDSTNTYVQVSRSDWDTVLDLCQSRCLFKLGGGEWKAGLELELRAIQACAAENSRLQSMGAFSDILVERAQTQERDMNRYNSANKKNTR